ncbi:hypothetical protein PV458_05100 [Streptomyces sp. MN03-5084-2B]|nr:hypothetical protein [Streptomyces sp. MN03-5084-2B]
MAVPEALAGLASIPGVRMAAELGAPILDASRSNEVLPVLPALAGVLPAGGLRRGTTVAVSGSLALVLALLVSATQNGSWAALTGLPELGLTAAAELGVVLDRVALVPRPGGEAPAVVSALIDGFDLVVLGPAVARGLAPQVTRRLAGRIRNRSTVLLTTGPGLDADLHLQVAQRRWHGTNPDGHGHLQTRDVVVTSRGRGLARPVPLAIQLPGIGGAVTAGEAVPGQRSVEVAG